MVLGAPCGATTFRLLGAAQYRFLKKYVRNLYVKSAKLILRAAPVAQ